MNKLNYNKTLMHKNLIIKIINSYNSSNRHLITIIVKKVKLLMRILSQTKKNNISDKKTRSKFKIIAKKCS